MRGRLRTNINDVIARNRSRVGAVRREQSQAMQEVAVVMERTATEILRRKVYSVRVPWRRTYDLLGRERWRADGVNVIGFNDSDHAAERAALGTSRGRPIRTPGVQRVDWQREAAQERQGYLLQVRTAAHRRAMNRR